MSAFCVSSSFTIRKVRADHVPEQLDPSSVDSKMYLITRNDRNIIVEEPEFLVVLVDHPRLILESPLTEFLFSRNLALVGSRMIN